MSKAIQHGDFCWTELRTTNTEEAKAFYQALFGWKYEEHDIAQIIYTMIKSASDEDSGGIRAIPKEKQDLISPCWLSYVYVDDVDEAVKKAEELGAKTKLPPMEITDYGRLAVLEDPAGAVFALWHPLKS